MLPPLEGGRLLPLEGGRLLPPPMERRVTEGQYFTVDSRALSFGEYWRLSPNPIVFAIAATMKLFRARLSFKYVIAAHLKPVVLGPEQVPPWAEKQLAVGGFFVDKGMSARLTYTLDMYGSTVSIARAYMDDDAAILAQVFASLTTGPPRSERTVVTCHTRIPGPRWIATVNRRPELASPPEFLGDVVSGGPAEVFQRHRERIRQANIERVDDLEQELAMHNRVGAAFQMKRGAWVLATPEEIAAARALTPPLLGA